MKLLVCVIAACLWLSANPSLAEARTICTIVVSVKTGNAIIEQGDCDQKMSPASTFKVAISLMGFDAGILRSVDEPNWPFKKGYIDSRPQWRQATTPKSWMRDSVIWYSQQVTRKLGPERYAAYVEAFDYGNQDLTGDPGKDNGLTRAWLSSSLQISPREQVAFLRRLAAGTLPVSAAAMENTARIMDQGVLPSGWWIHGKTGSGFPIGDDGIFVKGRAFGWFVGWAERGGNKVVFARLIEDARRASPPLGFVARNGVLADLFSKGGLLN
ncbi:MAG: class D beta-lactamase [Rhizobiaceae bacterium]|nr:class D beta-lactamase [Rhizobiaceae bacterium]